MSDARTEAAFGGGKFGAVEGIGQNRSGFRCLRRLEKLVAESLSVPSVPCGAEGARGVRDTFVKAEPSWALSSAVRAADS